MTEIYAHHYFVLVKHENFGGAINFFGDVNMIFTLAPLIFLC